MFAWFEVRSGPQAGQRFSVTGEGAVLGRAQQCQIVLADQRASRQHARISWQDGTWIIEDLGSTNGTFVNGQPVQPHVPVVVHSGDQVQLADTALGFQAAPEEAAVQTGDLPYSETTEAEPRRRTHPLVWGLAAVAVVLLIGLVVLAVVLLTAPDEVAEPPPTVAEPTGAVVTVLPSPTAAPEVQPTAELEGLQLPTVPALTLTPVVVATPESGQAPDETLAWLESLEGKLFEAGELILKFVEGVSDQQAQTFFAEQGLVAKDEIPALGLRLVGVDSGTASEALVRLAEHPLLDFVDLNALFLSMGEPNDAHWQRQWNMWIIEAPQGWDRSTGGDDVAVAVVDSGVDLNHPDLSGKLLVGYDFVQDDASPQDGCGHGTHVSGIAAAFGDNHEGVAGVSWGARILPVRVLDAGGSGPVFGIAEGMVWATDNGARVMNLSLGSPLPGMLAGQGLPGGDALEEAVNYAHSHNVLVVAAAGNAYQEGNPPNYPAAYAHVLAVGSTNDEDLHAYYSSAGSYVDVAAPGGEIRNAEGEGGIFSTLPTYEVGMKGYGAPAGYGAAQGTSMAAPHVAGLAALVWSMNPGLNNDQVQAIIEGAADDLGPPGWDGCFGVGRINVNRALEAASAGQVPPGGPHEHTAVMPSLCTDFTVLPEVLFPVAWPTIEWSPGP